MRRVFQAAGGACADGRTDVQELAGGGWCRVAAVTTVSITAATEVSAQGTSCQRHCGGGVVSVRGTLGTRGHRLQRAVWQESVPHLPTSLPHSAVSGPSGSGSRRGSVGLTGVQACERGQGHPRNAPCQFRPHRTQAGPRSPRHAEGSQGLQRGLTGPGPRSPARPGALGVLLSPEAPRAPLLPEARQKSPGLLSSPKSL